MATSPKLKFLPENAALDSTQQKEFNKKVTELKKKIKHVEKRGVIYLGHIPKGFYEPQMIKYFSQFGHINKLRIARSKRTGKSKGYAFVEFASESVAKIVADTMNNYLMFHRLLKCQLVEKSNIHPQLFKGSNSKFKRPKAHAIAKERHNRTKTPDSIKTAERKMKSKKVKSLSKLADFGIDFEYPGVVSIKGKDVSETAKEEDEDAQSDSAPEDLSQEAIEVLYDDSDEDEISFITPPKTRRMSLSKSLLENSLSASILGASTPGTGRGKAKSKVTTKAQKDVAMKLKGKKLMKKTGAKRKSTTQPKGAQKKTRK